MTLTAVSYVLSVLRIFVAIYWNIIPPKEIISDFMGYLKGKSTLMIYDRHPELQSKWDKTFWARGTPVC